MFEESVINFFRFKRFSEWKREWFPFPCLKSYENNRIYTYIVFIKYLQKHSKKYKKAVQFYCLLLRFTILHNQIKNLSFFIIPQYSKKCKIFILAIFYNKVNTLHNKELRSQNIKFFVKLFRGKVCGCGWNPQIK